MIKSISNCFEREKFKIVIYAIISIIITIVIYFLINVFGTSFFYVELIEKSFLKEEDEEVLKKISYYLKNILKYRILINLLNTVTYIYLIIRYLRLFNLEFYAITILVFVLVFIHLIARLIAKKDIYKSLVFSIDFIDFFMFILYPLLWMLEKLYNSLNILFNDGKNMEDIYYSEEDIKRMLNDSSNSDVEVEEKEMIHSIFNFTDTTVKEIMTPRTSIIAFDKDEILDNVWNDIIEHEFSRIPIFNESIDDIIGILYTKDLLKYTKNYAANIKLESLCKPVAYVPETKHLTDMLEYFRREQLHMAIIIDEYGGTLGLITIEDLLEEIVGEIRDEYDIEEEKISTKGEDIYEILGETLVEEINEELGIDIELSEEYDTISGYIQYKLGKVANVDDKVTTEGYIIQVLKVDNNKIEKIKLVIKR